MKKLRKALYPTRFDPLAFEKAKLLFPLKGAGLEEVVLLFVVDRDEVGFVPYGGFDKGLAEDLFDRARLRFADWESEIGKAGLRCTSLVETGRPATKILEVAAREGVDLIVAGRQHHAVLDALYLGGTAMELLRRSPVPVFVCKSVEEGGQERPCGESAFERVLYATDLSTEAAVALDVLKGLRGAAGHVDVVHVIGEADLDRLSEEDLRVEEGMRRQRLEAVRAELRGSGLPAETHLRAGRVVQEVLAAAEDRRSTLIVLATTEKQGLRELWLGSVSHRLAELSPLPVLLAPARPAGS